MLSPLNHYSNMADATVKYLLRALSSWFWSRSAERIAAHREEIEDVNLQGCLEESLVGACILCFFSIRSPDHPQGRIAAGESKDRQHAHTRTHTHTSFMFLHRRSGIFFVSFSLPLSRLPPHLISFLSSKHISLCLTHSFSISMSLSLSLSLFPSLFLSLFPPLFPSLFLSLFPSLFPYRYIYLYIYISIYLYIYISAISLFLPLFCPWHLFVAESLF